VLADGRDRQPAEAVAQALAATGVPGAGPGQALASF